MSRRDHPLTLWRQAHDVTQAELAQRCGVSQHSLAAYESYARVPHGQNLARLAIATALPLGALTDPETFLQEHPDFLRELDTPRPKLASPGKLGPTPRPKPRQGEG
jgi:transcriptional regulator with XRE-family HTH domain